VLWKNKRDKGKKRTVEGGWWRKDRKKKGEKGGGRKKNRKENQTVLTNLILKTTLNLLNKMKSELKKKNYRSHWVSNEYWEKNTN